MRLGNLGNLNIYQPIFQPES